MQLLDDHLWRLYQEGAISAEMMIDKARSAGPLVEKVHDQGGTIGRTELDTPEDQIPGESRKLTEPDSGARKRVG